MWNRRLLSSTVRPGHAFSMSSALVTTSPWRLIKMQRMSNARLPSWARVPSRSRRRACGRTRKGPKENASGNTSAGTEGSGWLRFATDHTVFLRSLTPLHQFLQKYDHEWCPNRQQEWLNVLIEGAGVGSTW